MHFARRLYRRPLLQRTKFNVLFNMFTAEHVAVLRCSFEAHLELL